MAQLNKMEFCLKLSELDRLRPIELMLISQIGPFMFNAAKTEDAQDGLKGQCALVSTVLKKFRTILPRSCNEEYLISRSLKRQLSDKSVVNKQRPHPALLNTALQKKKKD